MKKLESTITNMVLVLGIIAIVAGGLLAYLNKVTEGPIAAINEKNLNDGIKAVVGDAEAQLEKIDTLADEAGAVSAIIYTTDKGVAVSSQTQGFGGNLQVLVGFDAEGNIKGYRVLETHETPGLGIKAQEWFQADGKSSIIGKNPGEKALTVSKDGGDVDAITASTITSRAFLSAVNQAYNAYKQPSTDAASGASPQHHEPMSNPNEVEE